MQPSKDGTDRIFVLEQPGLIKVFPNNPSITNDGVSVFLDIRSKIAYSAGQEIGLLGLAFHPDFTNNGHVFVYYIDRPSNYRINIARYTVSESNSNSLDSSSEFILAQFVKNQGDSNHNGGKIAFGPDGYLYASIGDGGGGGDPMGNGQNLETVFGSIIRIDVDINGDNPLETNPEEPNGRYEIPNDNPRVGQSGLDELYAWGIRNTWKFSFDEQDRLWGADVGQNAYEEINIITRGGNYGWNRFEGSSQPSYGSNTELATSPDVKPIFIYDHNQGDVSITGGYSYKGSLNDPRLQNSYIYGDYVSGRVWALKHNFSDGTSSNELIFKTNGQFISSFGEDENGELYFLDYRANANIYAITETNTGPNTIAVDGIGFWKEMGLGTNGIVECLAENTNGDIIVGGRFTEAGGTPVSNIAVYDSLNTWKTLGSGSNGTIFSIAVSQNGLVYAAGDFSEIGGINANNIAYYDGQQWNPMALGTNGPISKIAFDNLGTTLYVGGVFSTAGSETVNNIAKWENGIWQGLTNVQTGSTGTNNEIRALAFDDQNNLYVGGNFDMAGGVAANRIAQWNGSTWQSLGTGTSGFVQAIDFHDGYLYAGGNFVNAGNTTVNRIARFDLEDGLWEPLGNGLSGNVNALVVENDYVYVTGTFETASNINNTNEIMNNVARWSSLEGWEAMGSGKQVGINTRGNALLFTEANNEIILGGNFNISGNLSTTNNISKWTEWNCDIDSIIPEYNKNGNWIEGTKNLTVAKGDTLIVSMLPNDVDFTIESPDGAVQSGDLNLGVVNEEDQGTYIIITEEGCVEEINIIVENNDIDDLDGDGISNTIDLCPNTKVGVPVDARGCSIWNFTSDQILLSHQDVICEGSNNGLIQIENSTSDSFIASLTGEGLTMSKELINEISFENLNPGVYEICLTSDGNTSSENCAQIVIGEPEPFTVNTSLDSDFKTLTIELTGASEYFVTLNGKTVSETKPQLFLPIENSVNELTVTTNEPCSYSYNDIIVLENALIAYPNPFNEEINIDLAHENIEEELITIRIYDLAGKQVYEREESNAATLINVNTENLIEGIYTLEMQIGTSKKRYTKIVK